MKKKLKLSKKTIKNLKLKLRKISNKKAAPLLLQTVDNISNGESC